MWMKYLKPYRKQAICGFLFKMIEAFFELVVPIVVADIIDVGIQNQSQSYILKRGALLLGLAFMLRFRSRFQPSEGKYTGSLATAPVKPHKSRLFCPLNAYILG